jgi:ketosteroid isomerase-like protein
LEHGDPVEALFDTGLVADHLEWVVPAPLDGRRVFTGRLELVEFLHLWLGEWENFSGEVEQVIDAGDDRVVSIFRTRATGKGSGVPVEWKQGAVNELRDGRVIRTTYYLTPADALEAAGLSE